MPQAPSQLGGHAPKPLKDKEDNFAPFPKICFGFRQPSEAILHNPDTSPALKSTPEPHLSALPASQKLLKTCILESPVSWILTFQ